MAVALVVVVGLLSYAGARRLSQVPQEKETEQTKPSGDAAKELARLLPGRDRAVIPPKNEQKASSEKQPPRSSEETPPKPPPAEKPLPVRPPEEAKPTTPPKPPDEEKPKPVTETKRPEQPAEVLTPEPYETPAGKPRKDDHDYRAIDAHARAAPAEATQSVAKLAVYLSRGARNEREKARAIFTWITSNLSYDWDAVPRGLFERRPDVLVRQPCTDCVGHSLLFEALARAMGLKVATIPGRARDLEADPAAAPITTRTSSGLAYANHAWNAVQVEGRWFLVDTTWGNGRRKRKGKIEVDHPTNPFMFLLRPSELIHTHLPNERRWQLLEKPFTQAQHEALPFLMPAAFRLGVEPVEPPRPVVTVDGVAHFTLKAPGDVPLIARVGRDRSPLKGNFTLVQRNPRTGLVEVEAAFPDKGPFRLEVGGRDRTAPAGRWLTAVQYRVEVRGEGQGHTFPELEPEKLGAGGYLYEPRSGVLTAGRKQTFKIKIPGALRAGVKMGEIIYPLKRKGDVFSGEFKVQAGELLIGAELPERKNYFSGVARFTAR